MHATCLIFPTCPSPGHALGVVPTLERFGVTLLCRFLSGSRSLASMRVVVIHCSSPCFPVVAGGLFAHHFAVQLLLLFTSIALCCWPFRSSFLLLCFLTPNIYFLRSFILLLSTLFGLAILLIQLFSHTCSLRRMNKTTLKRILTFVNLCLRKILGIQSMDKVYNKDLWERTNQVQI